MMMLTLVACCLSKVLKSNLNQTNFIFYNLQFFARSPKFDQLIFYATAFGLTLYGSQKIWKIINFKQAV